MVIFVVHLAGSMIHVQFADLRIDRIALRFQRGHHGGVGAAASMLHDGAAHVKRNGRQQHESDENCDDLHG